MLRALHGRWPHRRSHCRHDLHWLASAAANSRPCGAARHHLRPHFPAPPRRPIWRPGRPGPDCRAAAAHRPQPRNAAHRATRCCAEAHCGRPCAAELSGW